MRNSVEEVLELVFEGEIRTLGNLWEAVGWENAASYARDISGIKLLNMEDSEEIRVLRKELATLLRKLSARNLFVQEEVDRVLRGLRYEDCATHSPGSELH